MIKEYSTLCQCNHRLRPYSSTYKKIESMKKCRLHQTIFQKYKKTKWENPTFIYDVCDECSFLDTSQYPCYGRRRHHHSLYCIPRVLKRSLRCMVFYRFR